MLDNKTPSSPASDVVAGRNPVLEALKSGRPADALYIAAGAQRIGDIEALARRRGIVVKEVNSQKLDRMCPGLTHQGVALTLAAKEYATVAEILSVAEERNEKPFLLICDDLTDPHNLGALIRTADACGIHGIIIPERNSVGLTGTVAKASAGAVEYVRVARVKNLASTLDDLKKRGIWLYCADMDGKDINETDFSGAAAIVIGSEGSGVSRLVKEKCDFTVSIPMKGKINSLNASVAGAIMMFEASKGR